MVRFVRDTTGRFRERPHYEPQELDSECEHVITSFMHSLCVQMILPIPTDALTKLIERDASELDLYADLSGEGPDTHGVTEFFSDRKPVVRIARELSQESRRENRLRTTLTHEYGHVKFHAYLWATEQTLAQLHGLEAPSTRTCKRQNILQAAANDWMEWQAGYACGALLMPISQVKGVVTAFFESRNLYSPLSVDSPEAQALTSEIQATFQVSNEAARVRLSRMSILADRAVGPSLFAQIPRS